MTARVERDEHGIPTVTAPDLASLWRGQGRAVAEDRWWHLEWDRRRALGTSAALTGRPADTVGDGFARRARLGDAARRGFGALDADTRSMLEHQAAGINAVLDEIATGRRSVPLELEHLGATPDPWQAWHSVAVFLGRHVNFATWQTKLWRARVVATLGIGGLARLSPAAMRGHVDVVVPPGVRAAIAAVDLDAVLGSSGYDPGTLAALEPLGLGASGSNAWVVDGTRTATGRPIVAGDPHRAIEVPGVYYQIRLRCPAEGVVADGFCFPGIPGIQHFGQTEHVAFGVTNAMADYQDVYVERLPDALVDVRTETVAVRDGDDETIECGLSRHGPIVVGGTDAGVGIALASTGLDAPGGSLRTILPLLRAHTVADVDAALAHWVEPANNFVFADRDGHIGYRTAGSIPVRPAANNWLPVPGWVTDFDWNGVIPDDELPRQHDPADGAIVTANQRVTTDDHPHRLGPDVAPAGRANRIRHLLDDAAGRRRRLTVADMATIHTDQHVAAAERFALTSAHPALDGWDGSMAADSIQGAIYAEARDVLVRLLVDRLPEALRHNPLRAWEPPATSFPAAMRLDRHLDDWIADDDRWFLDEAEDWPAVLHRCVDAALVNLTDRLGADRDGWTWGTIHRIAPVHPLARELPLVRHRSGPVGGAHGAVMATSNHPGITHDATVGSTARYVWDLADPASSGWIVPLGASGDPRSPHVADQGDHYVAGRLLDVQPGPGGERRNAADPTT